MNERIEQLAQEAAEQGTKGEITILEGTCIDAEIKTTPGRVS